MQDCPASEAIEALRQLMQSLCARPCELQSAAKHLPLLVIMLCLNIHAASEPSLDGDTGIMQQLQEGAG